MSDKTFYGGLIVICVVFATIFLAGDSDDAFTFLFAKLIGIALIMLSTALYDQYRMTEEREKKGCIK